MLPNAYRDNDSVSSIRKKQIDTLKIFNDNVTEVKEDFEYKIDFTSGSNNLTLTIILGPEFPLEKPILKLNPRVHHSWLNENNEVVGAPGMLSYSVHSDLGRVVHAVIRQFQLQQPSIVSEQPVNSQEPRVSGTGMYGFNAASSVLASSASTIATTMPSIRTPTSQPITTPTNLNMFPLPELSKLSLTELKELNDNGDCLEDFLESLPIISELNRQLEDLMTQNEELAKNNLAKEPQMKQLQEETAEKLDEVTSLRTAHEKLVLEYQKLASKYSPQNIKENLLQEALKSDEESESIAEKFLNRNMDLDSFLSAYIHQRTISHIRKAKEERLGFQLKQLEKAGF